MNQDDFAQLCGERDAADAREAAARYAAQCSSNIGMRPLLEQAFLHGVAFQSAIDTEFFKETIDHLFKKLESEAMETE